MAEAPQFRFVNAFPVMGTVHYHLGDEFGVRPFFGIGVGTQRVEERLEIGRFVTERQNWKFAIAPEVGVFIPVSDAIQALVGVRYQHAFASGTSITGESVSDQYLSISIGLGFYNF